MKCHASSLPIAALMAGFALSFLLQHASSPPVKLEARVVHPTQQTGASPPVSHVPAFSLLRLTQPTRSSDVSFIRDSIPAPPPPADIIPVLAVFVRSGTAFLNRCIRSINFPVQTLLVVQDGEDDPAVAPLVAQLAEEVVGPHHHVRTLRHVINAPEHTGCAQAWNTVFRLYPTEHSWLFTANDIEFPPGSLGDFYARVRALPLDVGMISTRIDFGNGVPRETFGLMTWAVTRQGVIRGGLYDENFYPGYWEDDEIVWRYWLAGLKFYSVPVVTRHGNTTTYQTGTMLEDKTGGFARETARSRNEALFKAKWGPGVRAINYGWLDVPANRAAVLADCTNPSATRYCTPYNSGNAITAWVFDPKYRACIQGAVPPDCITVLPRLESMATAPQAPAAAKFSLLKEQAAYDASYALAMRRTSLLHKLLEAGPWDPALGFGTRNQAMLWDMYEPLYNCHTRQRLGRVGDGGKYVCNLDRIVSLTAESGRSCIVYSFGSNGEISFEEDLREASGGSCVVHVFDPVLNSVRHNNRYFNGPEAADLEASLDLPGFSWHTTGLGVREEQVTTARFGTMQLRRLSSIMAELGHSWIDILKVDIEGYEHDAFIADIFATALAARQPLPFGQLLIEVHVAEYRKTIEFLAAAEAAGLRMFNKDIMQYGVCDPVCRNVELSYVNVLTTPRLY